MLTFIDGAREGINITEATVAGVVRAMFDESGAGRRLRVELAGEPDQLGAVPGKQAVGDLRGRREMNDLLDRRDLGDLLARKDLDDLLGRLDPRGPRDPRDPPIDFGDIDFVPLDEFLKTGCVRDTMTGLSKLGAILGTVPRARPKRGAVIDTIFNSYRDIPQKNTRLDTRQRRA